MLRSAAIAVVLTASACGRGSAGGGGAGDASSNLPPGVKDDAYLVDVNTALDVSSTGSGVLANDTDHDTVPLTAQLVAGPASGTLVLRPDGTFTYVPAALFVGHDAFTYQASDGSLLSTVATVGIVVGLPDPEMVYGIEDGWFFGGAGIYRYPDAGGAPPEPLVTYPAGANSMDCNGLLLNMAGDRLYSLFHLGHNSIHEYDLAGQELRAVDVDDAFGFRVNGLQEVQGRIYMLAQESCRVLSFDPASGALDTYCSYSAASPGWMLSMAIGRDASTGRDDVPFYCGYGSPFCTGIYRQDFAGGTATFWAPVPAGSSYFNQSNSGGIVADGRDGLFYVERWDNRVFRYQDLNGDGDAMDAGECVVYATLPIPDCDYYHQAIGLALTSGGGLLVNVQPTDGDFTDHGIYWVADKDGSGAADGPGEVVLFNGRSAFQSDGATCITARR